MWEGEALIARVYDVLEENRGYYPFDLFDVCQELFTLESHVRYQEGDPELPDHPDTVEHRNFNPSRSIRKRVRWALNQLVSRRQARVDYHVNNGGFGINRDIQHHFYPVWMVRDDVEEFPPVGASDYSIGVDYGSEPSRSVVTIMEPDGPVRVLFQQAMLRMSAGADAAVPSFISMRNTVEEAAVQVARIQASGIPEAALSGDIDGPPKPSGYTHMIREWNARFSNLKPFMGSDSSQNGDDTAEDGG